MRTASGMVLAVVSAFLAAGAWPSTAAGQARVALLIGNQSYVREVGALKNPHNDIELLAASLKQVGFEVLPLVKDARRSTMLGAVRQLIGRLNTAGAGSVGFLYYSGHGAAESDTGINYLIPVDAINPDTTEFWDQSLKLDDVLKLLENARQAAHFVVFDACRNELRLPERTTGKGFIPVVEQAGMFVAFASAPGRPASDRGDRSGPYAAALAAEIVKPGQHHLDLFQNVKEAVIASTGGSQQPWERNGLGRRVFLAGAPPPKPADTAEPMRLGEAAEAWQAVKDSTGIPALAAYATRYKDTFYAELARQRIEELKDRQAQAFPPPPKPLPRPGGPAAMIESPAKNEAVPFTPGRSVKLKLQNTFSPILPIFQDALNEFAGALKDGSSGTLELDILPAGAIFPPFQALDAVHAGLVEAAWSTPSYYYGKTRASALYAGHVPAGLDAPAFVRWVEAEGAAHMNAILSDVLKLNVRSIPCAIVGPGGDWFKNPVRDATGLKGLKFRATGFSLEVGQRLGMSIVVLPGAELIAALDRGVIDGLEWLAPVHGVALGLPDVAKHLYYPGWTRPVQLVEFLIGGSTWERLHKSAQQKIENLCRSNVRTYLGAIASFEQMGLDQARRKGVMVQAYPPRVLETVRIAARKALDDIAAQDPDFAKVLASYDKYR